MRILACLITHNRLAYTKRAYKAWAGSDLYHDRMVIVDNASTDGTVEWLETIDNPRVHVILNPANLFPGAACNQGWFRGLSRGPADLLMRLDNDILLHRKWHVWVERTFRSIHKLGQLGLLNAHEDYPDGPPWEKWEEHGAEIYLANPGGPSVIRRELWDKGVRWMPGAWRPGGQDEDTMMSEHIRREGYIVGKAVQNIADNISFHRFDDYPDYYRQTAALRGLTAETSV